MVVKFKKFGYHVEKRSILTTRHCKHTSAFKICFGGKYCPTCERNIIEPKVRGRWKFDKISRSFHRDDNETVDCKVFIGKVGLKIVEGEEGYRILDEIVEERSLKEMKNLMISHGSITHSFKERMECISCLTVEITYLQAVKKAGGLKKFIKKLEKEITNK